MDLNSILSPKSVKNLSVKDKIDHAHRGLGIAAICIETLPIDVLGYTDKDIRNFTYRWPVQGALLAHILDDRRYLRTIAAHLVELEEEKE